VAIHQGLARALASKFAYRGEPLDDLIQIGCIGLIHAIDRYEPDRGARFSSFATPTIIGEILRHLRDRVWDVRAPRWLVELQPKVARANATLRQELGRPPTIREIADCVGATEEATVQAIEIGHTCGALSLDSDLSDDEETHAHCLFDRTGTEDRALARVEIMEALRDAIERLGGRERAVIKLRYFDDLTQIEVAKRLGISQMHVSRLQQRALGRLRCLLTDAGEPEDAICR
jgi:RNA polymerase sigma-B factor